MRNQSKMTLEVARSQIEVNRDTEGQILITLISFFVYTNWRQKIKMP